MAAREVLRMGHPVLREKAKAVENVGTPELRALVADMKETMGRIRSIVATMVARHGRS